MYFPLHNKNIKFKTLVMKMGLVQFTTQMISQECFLDMYTDRQLKHKYVVDFSLCSPKYYRILRKG